MFAQLNRNKGKKMQYKFIKTTVIASALSFASLLNVAHAGLISGNYIHNDNSVGVAVVYDTDSQLTWLQNALSYDVDGKGGKDRWGVISSWTQALDLDDTVGADGWRLPVMLSDNNSSEFSQLFSRSDFSNAGFTNIQEGDYWTGTSFTEDGIDKAYIYQKDNGESTLKQSSKRYAWVVYDGNFANLKSASIPEPSSLAILGLVVVGLFRRKVR